MAKIDTKELFDQARTINEEIEEKMELRADNRKLLRLLRDTGQLSETEERELEELYPPRERGASDDAGDTE